MTPKIVLPVFPTLLVEVDAFANLGVDLRA
jgi:hypothetical protein